MMLALMELFKRHTSQDSYKYRQFAGGLSMNIMALNLSFLKHKPCFVFSLLEEMQTNGESRSNLMVITQTSISSKGGCFFLRYLS